jgi:hypothetical protein
MPDKLDQPIGVVADGLCWLTVLGCIQLALRHPQYTGPSKHIAVQFAEQLYGKLLADGVLTEEEIAQILRDEMRAKNAAGKGG